MAIDFSEWQSVWVQAVALAWRDAKFKNALISDPRAALKAFLGFDAPGDFEIQVIERDIPPLIQSLNLVIPPKPTHINVEAEELAEYANTLLTAEGFFCVC